MTVTQLTCGHNHSIVVTNQSTVYAWGCNERGQLGLGDTKLRSRPVRVDRLWGIPVVTVAAGGEHSLAVTTNGMLFSWGSNSAGQLGHPYNVEEAEEMHKRCVLPLRPGSCASLLPGSLPPAIRASKMLKWRDARAASAACVSRCSSILPASTGAGSIPLKGPVRVPCPRACRSPATAQGTLRPRRS